MDHLVAHKVKVHLNNKQSSWMPYNFAIEKLRSPMMSYEACLEAAEQPARYSSRIDGAVQPAALDFKKIKFPSAFDVSKQWTLERDGRHPWMKEKGLNLDTVSGVFNNNYGAALNQWKLAKWHPDKKPTFHGKGHKLSSTWRGRAFKPVDGKTFAFPNKRGTFRLGCPLRFQGELRSIHFTWEGGAWYASFLIKTSLQKPESAPQGTVVGIDVGVAQFASLSDGEQFAPAMDYESELERLAKLQRQLSRMQGPVKRRRKASKNWLKQQKKVQRQHRRIANKRRHYIEIVSKSVATRFETVAVEDLSLKNMTASAKGDAEKPGKNVNAKAGLNRSILNGGFYQFRTRLEAKVKARGGTFHAVHPAYTSQTCAACGHVAKENRRSQEKFQCVACGHENNADINAAQNILIRALSGQENVVPLRRKADQGRQVASPPESLPTCLVGDIAQESDKQDAMIATLNLGKAAKPLIHHTDACSRNKKVKREKKLDFSFTPTG